MDYSIRIKVTVEVVGSAAGAVPAEQTNERNHHWTRSTWKRVKVRYGYIKSMPGNIPIIGHVK